MAGELTGDSPHRAEGRLAVAVAVAVRQGETDGRGDRGEGGMVVGDRGVITDIQRRSSR